MRKLTILIALLPVFSFAAEPFESIINEIQTNNPTLAAERAALVAEITQRGAANKLDAAEIGFDRTWATQREGGTKMSVSVAQSFDWPGAYGVRSNALRSVRAYAAKRFEASRRALALEAHTGILQVIDANLRCELLSMVVDNVDSVSKQLQKLLEQREVTALDCRKASLALIDAKQAYVEAEQARAEALNGLAALNGGILPGGVADLKEYPCGTLQPLENYLERGSAEAEASRAEAATSRLDAKSAKMGIFPGFSVGYIFQREGGMSFNGFSIGLRLPKYSAKAEANAAQLLAQSREMQAQAEDASRNAAIISAYRSAQNAAKLLKEYDDALSDDYEVLLRKSLDGGQITYLNYFTELNYYLERRLDCYSRQLKYQILIATLQNL